MKDLTITYLRDWNHWALNGAPDQGPFKRFMGLCGNAKKFERMHGLKTGTVYDDLRLALKMDFGSGTANIYPFGSEATYWADFYNDTAHTNEKRLAWVASKI